MHTPVWSTTLFFWTQHQVGKYVWLDQFMRFCAVWLIWIFGFLTLVYFSMDISKLTPHSESIGYDLSGSVFVASMIMSGFIMSGFIVWGFVVSWIFALFFREKRPELEQAGVKTLIRPFQTFKSFPSDHAMVATILLIVTYSVGDMVVLVPAIFLAVCVMASRVYVGAHYPHDIVGGIVTGLFALALAITIARIFFLVV